MASATINVLPLGTSTYLSSPQLGRNNPFDSAKMLARISIGSGVHLLNLQRGQIVQIDGVSYIFTHATTDEAICLTHERTGRHLDPTFDELCKLHRQGRLVVLPPAGVELPKGKLHLLTMPLSAFPQETRMAAVRRARYCIDLDKARTSPNDGPSLSIAELKPFIRMVALEHGLKPCSAGSLIRWYRWWRAGHRRLAVLCHSRAKRRATARMATKVLCALWDALESVWVPNENATYEDVRNAIRVDLRALAEKEGSAVEGGSWTQKEEDKRLGVPAISTIARYANRLDRYQVVAAEQGTYEANRLFEPRGKLEIPTVPNALWEIDHHQLKIDVAYKAFDRNGNVVEVVLGSPWLTVVIDVHSRAILAFNISFEPPSTLRTMQAIKMAMRPKDDLCDRFPDLQFRMDFFGFPVRIRCDRGRDFFSKDLLAALMDLGGLELDATHAYSPWEKPYVERFFLTLQSMLIRKIPGHVPRPGKRKRGPKPKKQPKHLTLEQLEEVIVRFIDLYHDRPHAGLGGRTPGEAWDAGLARLAAMQDRNPTLRVRSSLERTAAEYDQIFTIRRDAKLSRNSGIRLFGLDYNSGELGRLWTQGGDRMVEVRLNPANIEAVLVRHDKLDTFITVPCTEVKYATGLPLWAHTQMNNWIGLEDQKAVETGKARPKKVDWGTRAHNLLMRTLGLLDAGPRARRRDLQQAARTLGGKLDLGLLAAKLVCETQRTGKPAIGVDFFAGLDVEDGRPEPSQAATPDDEVYPAGSAAANAPGADPFATLDAAEAQSS